MNWQWKKSSYSATNGECVEIARPAAPQVGMRDSKNPEAGHIQVSQTSFDTLMVRIKADSA